MFTPRLPDQRFKLSFGGRLWLQSFPSGLRGDLPLQPLEANLHFADKQSQQMIIQLSLRYIPHFHFFHLQSVSYITTNILANDNRGAAGVLSGRSLRARPATTRRNRHTGLKNRLSP
jgi:hypothetical protein